MMEPISVQLQELREHTGWPIKRVILETGISRTTYYRKLADPVEQPARSDTNSMLIYMCNRTNVPSPLGEYQSIMDNIHFYQESMGKSDYTRYLKDLLLLIEPENETGQVASIKSYLKGLILYQLRYCAEISVIERPRLKDILSYYSNALAGLDINSELTEILALKIRITMFVIYFMGQPIETRSTSNDIRRQIINEDFLANVDRLLAKQYWNWKAARNGLVAASILGDGKACTIYWEALCRAQPAFKDPNFTPKGLRSVKNDPDLKWFSENILNSLLIEQAVT
ncbi:MAG: hypothetical protein AB2777_20810 [Candidatus Thiodiazotropha endolucinida]